jgi:polyhydroxybutyrate depolymerase
MRLTQTALLIAAAVTMTSAQGRGVAGLTSQTWMVNGVERSALIAAPATRGTDKGGPPLVLVFHGHGGSSAQAARSFRLHEAWPEAIVIYPQGVSTVGQVTDPEGRQPGWQHRPGGAADRDLKFVDVMLTWAAERYAFNSAQLFAAGHSNGGSMVYVLWAARGDRFAAFAPSSSVFRLAEIKTAKPKPVFIVAGRQDALVPFATQQLSLAGVLRLNQAPREGQKWSGAAQRHTSAVGADVVTYIHPGGHPMPADSGALMVQFFKSVVAPVAR